MADKFKDLQERWRTLLVDLDNIFGKYNVVNQIATQTKQRVAFVVLAGVALALLIVLFLFGFAAIANLVAIYPVYKSFKALRSGRHADDSQWLTYWIVFAAWTLVESLLEPWLCGDDAAVYNEQAGTYV